MSLSITLHFKGQNYELAVDLDDSVEVLRFQVYSLTDVPPEEQEIIGMGSGILRNDCALKDLGLTQGQFITMNRKAASTTTSSNTNTGGQGSPSPASTPATAAAPWLPAPSRPAAAPTTPAPFFPAASNPTQGACTRTLVPSKPLRQPAFAPNSPAGSDVRLCVECARTCRLPQHTHPRPMLEPFACGCACEGGDTFCVLAREDNAMAEKYSETCETTLGKIALNDVGNVLMQSVMGVQPAGRGEQRLLSDTVTHMRQAIQYLEPSRKAVGLRSIPLAKLEERARANPQAQEFYRDELLWQLAVWFKNEFFKWVNAAPCDSCSGETTCIGATRATPQEAQYGAGNVEVYKCNSGCAVQTRFPRYNDAVKLVETRCGRCGEWANTFTFLCTCLGYDARLVHDYTDHVWTEVWSVDQKRWLHVDACEPKFDAPLMYEAGWGKKLTYCLAYSASGVTDVTRRYTRKYDEVLQRRQLGRETFLTALHTAVNTALDAMHVPSQVTERVGRRKVEAEELSVCADRALSEAERQGRISGSVAWRKQRAELGGNNADVSGTSSTASLSVVADSSSHQPAEFNLAKEQILHQDPLKFRLRYNTSRDLYYVGDKNVGRVDPDASKLPSHSDSDEISAGMWTANPSLNVRARWHACAHSFSNIEYHFELGWNVNYISRTTNDPGEIVWKFHDADKTMTGGSIRAGCNTHSGAASVVWSLSSDGAEWHDIQELTPAKAGEYHDLGAYLTTTLNKPKTLYLRARLHSTDGNRLAASVFRGNRPDLNAILFDITLNRS